MNTIFTELQNTVSDFMIEAKFADVDWESKPGATAWSKKEIVGHLIDSAQINLQRLVRCTFEENFKLIYMQDEWVSAQQYQTAQTDDLLQLWRLLNRQIMHVLNNYPASRLKAQCDTGKMEVSLHTVEWLAKDYLKHLLHHLDQIKA